MRGAWTLSNGEVWPRPNLYPAAGPTLSSGPSMHPLLQAATIGVAVLGLFSLVIARMPRFREDFRRSVSVVLGAVALLTILLSLNVMLAGLRLRDSAALDDVALINGLLLTGFVLLLVSSLAFFFSLGLLIWTLVPAGTAAPSYHVADPSSPQPVDPYTP